MKAADGRHLVDDQMIAVYIGAEPRFGRQNKALEHLYGCAACAQRYNEMIKELTDLRDDAAAEADAIFTPDRLEAQRAQIMQRLEHVGHPARVIPFPSHTPQNLSIFTGSQVRRWIAAAAAAGLFIGLTLGRMTDFLSTPRNAELRVPAAVTTPVERPAAQVPQPTSTEEEILSRAEQAQALGEMQVPASLEALSAMTPIPIQEVALRLPSR